MSGMHDLFLVLLLHDLFLAFLRSTDVKKAPPGIWYVFLIYAWKAGNFQLGAGIRI